MKKTMILKALGALLVTAALVGCSGGVTQAAATDIALEHAGVAQQDTVSLSVKEDSENGRDVYEIEFATQDAEYHYDVAKNNGEIVNYSYDKEGGSQAKAEPDQKDEQAAGSQKETAQSALEQAQKDEEAAGSQAAAAQSATEQAQGGAITQEQAQAIALEHAGVTAEEATIYKVKADFDDGRAVYDVEFAVGATEYDYEIAQSDGRVLSYDSDVEGWTPAQGGQAGISLEDATRLVLDRVPGAAAENVRIQFERDDGRDIYEGELYYERTEYEFEIDASTGAFIEWSVDYQD